MTENNPKNKCQYWVEEYRCRYWSIEEARCLYGINEGEDNTYPTFYPYCNFVGSEVSCSKFSPYEDKQFFCALPDPFRHVGNHRTSSKWASYVHIDNGTFRLDTSQITGFTNHGRTCEESGSSGGTNKECSGYAPYHMGFGIVKPDKTEEEHFSFRLPLNYEVINIRSIMSTCYWWSGSPSRFKVADISIDNTPVKKIDNRYFTNSTTSGTGSSKPITDYPKVTTSMCTCGCTRTDTSDFLIFSYDNIPCNGSHTGCPHYTGICWEYVRNDKLETGDKVLAEQILELRYYLKGGGWTNELYDSMFLEPTLYSWGGNTDYEISVDGEYSAKYDVVKVGLDLESSSFTLKRSRDILYEGSPVSPDTGSSVSEGFSQNFPSLIREVKEFLFSPRVLYNLYLYNGKYVYESRFNSKKIASIIGTNHTDTIDSLCINLSKLDGTDSLFILLEEEVDINFLYVSKNFELTGLSYCHHKTRFSQIQDDISAKVIELRTYHTDSVSENTLGNCRAFFYNIHDPVIGENKLCLLTKYNNPIVGDYWGYSFFTFYNIYISGYVTQNHYKVALDKHGIVDRLYDFRRSLLGLNPEVELNFEPFMTKGIDFSPLVVDVYNCFSSSDSLSSALYRGYTIYNCSKEFKVYSDDLMHLEPSVYILVTLNDNNITEVYGDITILANSDNDLYIYYPDTNFCPLEVVKQGIDDGLPSNQLLLKPKNDSYFHGICDDSYVYIKKVTFVKKVSYATEFYLDGWEVEKDELYVKNTVVDVSGGNISINSNTILVQNFNHSVSLSLVLSGPSGIALDIVNYKAVVWVKQPMCPDVEIFYKWKASAKVYKNVPVCTCCGYYLKTFMNNTTVYNTPPCGDHATNPDTGVGPMWFPYVQCASFSYYSKINNQIYGGITKLKGLYKENDENGLPLHGSWDIRMEGPDMNDFFTGEYCCSICHCTCPVRSYNIIRDGSDDAYFYGSARYRGGVSTPTLAYWNDYGGSLPKFGNVSRPQLKSYRSTDYIQYIYYNYLTRQPATFWMWMPSIMSFSSLYDNDHVFDQFCDGPVPIDGLGTMLFSTLDGKLVNEKISKERYSYQEVFSSFCTAIDIAYPKALKGVDDSCKKPVPQFNTINGKTIQWAWRELSRDIVRNYEEDAFNNQEEMLGSKGISFIDISFPNYEYSKGAIEHTIVCNEGVHVLHLEVPELNDEGKYPDDKFPTLRIDNGPKRCFSWYGGFDVDDCSESPIDYQKLTNFPWLNVSLFVSGYSETISDAESKGHKIIKDVSDTKKEFYYNRGINVDRIFPHDTTNVPVVYTSLSTNDFTYILPANNDANPMSGTFFIDFDFSGMSYAISKGSISFKFGIEDGSDLYKIFCVPSFSVILNDIVVFTYKQKIPNFFGTIEKVVDFDYELPFDLLYNRTPNFKIRIDADTPSEVPCVDLSYVDDNGINRIHTYVYVTSIIDESIYLFDTVLTNVDEKIYVHERKYRVSFFETNLIPPHGTDNSKLVLMPRFDKLELDTVWQRDRGDEVVNMPGSSGNKAFIHKTRSRFVFSAIEDKKIITGNIYDKEKAQKDLYDKIMKVNVNTLSYRTVYHPELHNLLEKYNLHSYYTKSYGTMENNSILNLGTLIEQPKFQANGYQLQPSQVWHESCKRTLANTSRCTGDDTFRYVQVNMDDGVSEVSPMTGIDIYTFGSLMMYNRIKLAKFMIARMFATVPSKRGKVFEEDDVLNVLFLPYFFPFPAVYPTDTGTVHPVIDHNKWPRILPGLWQTLGRLYE